MKKRILIILAIVSLIFLSGCNFHLYNWEREHCGRLGYGKEGMSSVGNLVRCDNCTHKVYFHVKSFEAMDDGCCKNPNPIRIEKKFDCRDFDERIIRLE